MVNYFSERLVLFISVIKWTIYASLVGIIVGISTTIFLKTLTFASSFMNQYPNYYVVLPIALLLSSLLVKYLAPQAQGHGTEKVIEAVHKTMGRIPLAVVPVKLIATVITLACGGSAGKEGPCAQIGGGLASKMADILKVNDIDRQKLVICGISAGFAAVFGTPIAGALFGVEVLFLGQLLYDVLFPAFVSGMIGYYVAVALGVNYFHQTIRMVPEFSQWVLLTMILMGIFCGIVSFLLIKSMDVAEKGFEKIKWYKPLNAVLGGLILVLIGFVISPNYLGLSIETMEAGLRGQLLPLDAFFWKIIATAVTLGCGGSGGIITPVFVIGTAAGNFFAAIINSTYVSTFSAIGMVSVLAGAANTPISASVMAMELFGPVIGPYAALSCVVSYLLAGHCSVYPSQVLSKVKTPSLCCEQGKAICELRDIEANPRPNSLFGPVIKWYLSITEKK